MRKLSSLIILATTALVCGSARADIVGLTSDVPIKEITPPSGSTVGSDFLETLHLTPAIAFDEQQNVVLGSSLKTDTGTIAAGTLVSSYFIAFNDPAATAQSTTITFSDPVLGIVYEDGSSSWAASDFLGLPSLTYKEDPANCPLCGFEAGETATFSGSEAFLKSTYDDPGDFARVITAGGSAVTPEPSSLILVGTASLMLAQKLRRRQTSSVKL
jgi:hypothetical protein